MFSHLFVEFSTGKMFSHIAETETKTFCGAQYVPYGEGGQTHWHQSGVELPRVVDAPTRAICSRCQQRKETGEPKSP